MKFLMQRVYIETNFLVFFHFYLEFALNQSNIKKTAFKYTTK